MRNVGVKGNKRDKGGKNRKRVKNQLGREWKQAKNIKINADAKIMRTERAKEVLVKAGYAAVLRLQISWTYCDSALPDRSQQIHQRNRICSLDTKQSRHGDCATLNPPFHRRVTGWGGEEAVLMSNSTTCCLFRRELS